MADKTTKQPAAVISNVKQPAAMLSKFQQLAALFPSDQKFQQLAALFSEADIVGFKTSLASLVTYKPTSATQFFCLNPLKQPGSRLTLDQVACFRNILVEMDFGALTEQWDKIEASGLPWTTCVYSGGKSLHFIVSITDGGGIDSHFSYTKLAREICESLGADTSAVNPNRLTRLGGVVRDNGVAQELIEVRPQTSLTTLMEWRYLVAPKKLRARMDKVGEQIMLQELASSEQHSESNVATSMPPAFTNMLQRGILHPDAPTSRHQSLVKFAVWLKEHWHEPDGIEELLSQAAEAMGIDGRGDVAGILRWLK